MPAVRTRAWKERPEELLGSFNSRPGERGGKKTGARELTGGGESLACRPVSVGEGQGGDGYSSATNQPSLAIDIYEAFLYTRCVLGTGHNSVPRTRCQRRPLQGDE